MKHRSLLFRMFFHLRRSLMNCTKDHTSTVKHSDKYLESRKNNFVLYYLLSGIKKKNASKTNRDALKQFFYVSSHQLSHWKRKKFQSKHCLNLKPALKSTKVNVKTPCALKGCGVPIVTCFCSIWSLVQESYGVSHLQIHGLLKRVVKLPPKMAKALPLPDCHSIWSSSKRHSHNTQKLEGSIKSTMHILFWHFLILRCFALLFKERSHTKYARVI